MFEAATLSVAILLFEPWGGLARHSGLVRSNTPYLYSEHYFYIHFPPSNLQV